MSRSLYKMPYISQTLRTLFQKTALNNRKSAFANAHVKIYARAATITPDLIGFSVQIHNGRGFSPLTITPNMIGYKFGSFAVSKRTARYRKQKK